MSFAGPDIVVIALVALVILVLFAGTDHLMEISETTVKLMLG